MNQIQLNNPNSPQYNEFITLYAKSFPLFEQRTPKQQIAAFASPNYHLTLYYKESQFIGFIAAWLFDQYSYIEHFAIHEKHRGCGYGAQLLNQFIEEQTNQVILEIDPIVDEISAARWRFYKRCGFYQNSYQHIHPPYRANHTGHSLIILSSKGQLSTETYQQFVHELNNRVMQD